LKKILQVRERIPLSALAPARRAAMSAYRWQSEHDLRTA
jgi:hypothetical protein